MTKLLEKKPKGLQVEDKNGGGGLIVLNVLPRAQVVFKTEKYMGAPEPDIEPYERVLYRYSLKGHGETLSYEYLEMQVQVPAFEGKTARFGRDEKFKTMDFIAEVLASDVNVSWANKVSRCYQCGDWVCRNEDFGEDPRDRTNVACIHCADEIFKRMNEDARVDYLKNKTAKDRAFAEQTAARLGLPETDVLEYLIARPRVAKENLRQTQPVAIDRFTCELTVDKPVWPEWFLKSPKPFQDFVRDTGAQPIDLVRGQLPVDGYKKVRQAHLDELQTKENEKALAENREPEKLKSPLPASPRVMGILQAYGAPDEVIRAFEGRMLQKGFSTVESVKNMKEESMFISNESAPLFNIGTWGEKHYQSCQNWKNTQQWTDQYCKTYHNLEDPHVLVAWVGEKSGVMKTRCLLRVLEDEKSKKKLLGIDRWYGNAANQQRLIKALQNWCEAQGMTLVTMHGGAGNPNPVYDRDRKNVASYPSSVTFSRNEPSYTDMGGWAHPAEGRNVQQQWIYRVTYTACK